MWLASERTRTAPSTSAILVDVVHVPAAAQVGDMDEEDDEELRLAIEASIAETPVVGGGSKRRRESESDLGGLGTYVGACFGALEAAASCLWSLRARVSLSCFAK